MAPYRIFCGMTVRSASVEVCDDSPAPGTFILTFTAQPLDLSTHVIGILGLATIKLSETW
jgi:hypothetical protein